MNKPVLQCLPVLWSLLISISSWSLSSPDVNVLHYKVLSEQTMEVPAVMEIEGESFVFPVAIYANPYHRFRVVSLPESGSGWLHVLFNGPVDILKADAGLEAWVVALETGEYRLSLEIKGVRERQEREIVIQGKGEILPLKSKVGFSEKNRVLGRFYDDLPDHWLSYIAPDKSGIIPVVENDVAIFMMRSGGKREGRGGGAPCQCSECQNSI